MPTRTPFYNESKGLHEKIKDRLQNLCNLSITLQTLYRSGASSTSITATAESMEADLAELREWIAKYDEVENQT